MPAIAMVIEAVTPQYRRRHPGIRANPQDHATHTAQQHIAEEAPIDMTELHMPHHATDGNQKNDHE